MSSPATSSDGRSRHLQSVAASGFRLRSAAIRSRSLLACAGCVLLVLTGCASTEGPSPVLIPNRELNISSSLSIPAEGLVLGAIVWIAVDPLAPNWRIEQYELGGGRYAFALIKKRFTTGGDGEAMQVLRRRAAELRREKGFHDYDIVEFEAGIQSDVPIAQRVARAVVQYR